MSGMRALYLVIAAACAFGAYTQLEPRIDCAALNYKYFAPASRPGMAPLAPPRMSQKKCDETAASFKARGLEVPTVPLTQRRGWAVFVLGAAAALVLVARPRRAQRTE